MSKDALLNDGPENGRYHFDKKELEVGQVLSYPGGDYVIEEWPNGELVGVWNGNKRD